MAKPTIAGKLGFFYDGGVGDQWIHNGADWEVWYNEAASASPTGFESVTDGGANTGLRPVGRPVPEDIIYNIGEGALDMNIPMVGPPPTGGASGKQSISFGSNLHAKGDYSLVRGSVYYGVDGTAEGWGSDIVSNNAGAINVSGEMSSLKAADGVTANIAGALASMTLGRSARCTVSGSASNVVANLGQAINIDIGGSFSFVNLAGRNGGTSSYINGKLASVFVNYEHASSIINEATATASHMRGSITKNTTMVASGAGSTIIGIDGAGTTQEFLASGIASTVVGFLDGANDKLHSLGTASYARGIVTNSEIKAIGDGSTAIGWAVSSDTTAIISASGRGSFASGTLIDSTATGITALGDGSHALGGSVTATRNSSLAIGELNKGHINSMFEVGIGSGSTTLNAFEVFDDGVVVAPELTINKISQLNEAGDAPDLTPNVDAGKILITKEYGDTTYSASGFEAVTDGGSNTGLRPVGWDAPADSIYYIGHGAIDMNIPMLGPPASGGASGRLSFARCENMHAKGEYSTVIGNGLYLSPATAAGKYSTVLSDTAEIANANGMFSYIRAGGNCKVVVDAEGAEVRTHSGSEITVEATAKNSYTKVKGGIVNVSGEQASLNVLGYTTGGIYAAADVMSIVAKTNGSTTITTPATAVASSIRVNCSGFGDKVAVIGSASTVVGYSHSGIGLHIKATGNASYASGELLGDSGTIESSGSSSYARGYVDGGSVSYMNKLSAGGSGSTAIGHIEAGSASGEAGNIEALGDGSFASGTVVLEVGQGTKAIGDGSHALGANVVTTRDYSLAAGSLNKGHANSMLEIGIGTSVSLNGFEVFDDGVVVAPELTINKISQLNEAGDAPEVTLNVDADKILVTKEYVQHNGITADRPVTPSIGQFYFDTTVTRPTWWNGADWTDAAGNTVFILNGSIVVGVVSELIACASQADLTWTAASGATIVGYELWRDGALRANVGDVLGYTDLDVFGGKTYEYKIRAIDSNGLGSAFSNTIGVEGSTVACP